MRRVGTVALGLTCTEAGQRLQHYGPNEAAEERRHAGRWGGTLWGARRLNYGGGETA
jgi:hypothetical protein